MKFLNDLGLYLATKEKKLEILRPHTDAYGYDLILKVGDATKYIQLKSLKKKGRAQKWDLHKSFLQELKGKIILIIIHYHDQGMKLSYRLSGKTNNEHVLKILPKYKKDSKKYCAIRKGDFHDEVDIQGLADKLFKLES